MKTHQDRGTSADTSAAAEEAAVAVTSMIYGRWFAKLANENTIEMTMNISLGI